MTPLPPKQGLKHVVIDFQGVNLTTVMTPLPPKQGLKQAMEFYWETEYKEL